jgi:hypothetical protein
LEEEVESLKSSLDSKNQELTEKIARIGDLENEVAHYKAEYLYGRLGTGTDDVLATKDTSAADIVLPPLSSNLREELTRIEYKIIYCSKILVKLFMYCKMKKGRIIKS